MGVLDDDLAVLFSDLDAAIGSVMEKEMTDEARQTIREHIYDDVYSYEPRFYSRRKEAGGIADKDNMEAQYEAQTMTLTVTETADFQQLWGGDRPDYTTLADEIERGNPKFSMKRAGKRPFMKNTQKELDNGRADKIIETGLKRRGF